MPIHVCTCMCISALLYFGGDFFFWLAGAPFYPPSRVCPDASYVLGSCNQSECQFDTDCRQGSCCLNNCNQRVCVMPVVELPVCTSVVNRLSSNASYVPQCLDSGYFRPMQCLTIESGDELCWCVNSITGVPFTDTSNDGFPDCNSECVSVDRVSCESRHHTSLQSEAEQRVEK